MKNETTWIERKRDSSLVSSTSYVCIAFEAAVEHHQSGTVLINSDRQTGLVGWLPFLCCHQIEWGGKDFLKRLTLLIQSLFFIISVSRAVIFGCMIAWLTPVRTWSTPFFWIHLKSPGSGRGSILLESFCKRQNEIKLWLLLMMVVGYTESDGLD